jgi:Domain of unknown function (DUF4832)/Domain of unknown function (DUF4874)
MMKILLLRFALHFFCYLVVAGGWFCTTDVAAQTTTVNYTTSTLDFANPERGFYHQPETHSNAYDPLSTATLTAYRTTENITLVRRMFYLDDFVSSPISAAYLNLLQADLNAIRNAGIKCIVRFAYTNQTVGGRWPPESPYGDATKAWILSHIAQLEPYLQNNSDVIAVVEAGFIGIWGEWFYTTHLGDPLNGAPSVANYADRKDIADRLLTALPSNRMIQLRIPYYKYRMYRASALTPISLAESFGGSSVSRIGHHNDCFLASSTDYGTYVNTATEYNYLSNDTRYAPMGGENCVLNAPRTDCAGDALNELSLFHWSFINLDYINTVWNAWNTQGCTADIKKKLGYRIQLNSGNFTTTVKPGGSINIALSLTNTGWASMFNPRLLEFVLINTADGKVCKATTNEEPRRWTTGGTVNLSYEIGIPANYPNGTYKLLLSLPDPMVNLYEKAAYSVRLANTNTTWDNVKGYNDLGFNLTVNSALVAPTYTGSAWFSTCYGALPVEWINFQAVQSNQEEVSLSWSTTQEVNNDYFLVQKSVDGKSFETIGKVYAGSQQTLNNYEFKDHSLTKGVTYYRIAQYDIDGSHSYSKIINLFSSLAHQLIVSPNPFDEETQLFVDAADQEKITVLINDMNGHTVWKEEQHLTGHSLHIGKRLAPGVYMVVVSTPSFVSYTKVVKIL